mmetsp:Transcript_4542/g.8511  ORF Transcript_4542/g.8511 Transcript_4542/m.8511 type:complete len:233 (+) Transcript_4542:195-893(+)
MLAESLLWDAAHASSIEPMTPCVPRAKLVAPPHSTLRSSSAHAQTSSQQVPFRARATPQLVAPTNNIDNVVANVRLSLGENDTGTKCILYFVAMVLTSRNASNDDLMRVGQRRSDFNQDLSEYLGSCTRCHSVSACTSRPSAHSAATSAARASGNSGYRRRVPRSCLMAALVSPSSKEARARFTVAKANSGARDTAWSRLRRAARTSPAPSCTLPRLFQALASRGSAASTAL